MSTDFQIQAEKIIDDSINDFLKAVNSIAENGYFRKVRRNPSAFEILKPANDEFYEYAYFERTLEWYIRDILINPSIASLLNLFGIECLLRDEKLKTCFTNEAIENIYPFEFIVLKNDKKIGYRYTTLAENEIDNLLSAYQLDEIVMIDWSTKEHCYQENDSRFIRMSFKDFCEGYFRDLDTNLLINKFKKAIKEANDDIGFDTIPKLSIRNLSNFKESFDLILKKQNYREMRFLTLPNHKNKEDYSCITFDDGDYKICDDSFLGEKLYKDLLGKEDFAKCFVTAEYLYNTLGQGNNFDYTSVVCGYLKAIEQLIYKLVKINLNYPSQDVLWIKAAGYPKNKENVRKNPNGKGNNQVLFDKKNERYFNIELGSLIYFIYDNKNGWRLSNNGREIVFKFLRSFLQDCRNDHFHKDNINDFETVKIIRNNTIFLMYLLIGGYKLSGDADNDRKLLGIKDDTFDRLYKNVQNLPRGIRDFVLSFDGKNEIKAFRCFNQEETKYDENGSVDASRLKFVKTNVFSNEAYCNAMEGLTPDNELIIDKNNIPKYIAFKNGRGEIVEIDF